MKLIIAEKPSVAAAYAAALGAKDRKDGYIEGTGYIISWCIGHLVELVEAAAYGEQYRKWSLDSLPILPEAWQYTVSKDKGKQFSVLKELMRRPAVTEVINGCDAGREGELIFRYVYELAGCTKPIKRLWLSSMEEAAIKEGFSRLKDGKEYDALYASALCRAKADWLVGINMTRLYSCLYGTTLSVGRVQTPTLEMLTDRDAAITAFKKEKYYHVRLSVGGMETVSERLKSKEDAETLKAACEKSQAVCVSVSREKKTVSPPKLFDLTSMQREANRIYGYTAKQTLDLAQSLYEKRLLTYPRTDSNYLTDDMADTAAQIVTLLCGRLPFMGGVSFTPEVSKLLDSKKVSDHHAIIPTMELEKADLSALPETERNILILAGARLLFAAAQPHVYEETTAVFSCADTKFTAKGKTVISEGWKELERRFRLTLKRKPDTEDEENDLMLDVPELSEGESFESLSAMERAGNEDTDKDAERKGLGTPATRAAVIEKLIKGGLIQRKGKQLLPTKNGHSLTDILPDTITSPKLTSEWENALLEIARGKADAEGFMRDIQSMVRELVAAAPAMTDADKGRFGTEKKVIGKCPRCGADVCEGRKNYYCTDTGCVFVMWKNDRFFEERKTAFTPKIAAELLKSGKAKVKKLYSQKTGKTYDGTVLLADTGGKYVNYKVAIQREQELE